MWWFSLCVARSWTRRCSHAQWISSSSPCHLLCRGHVPSITGTAPALSCHRQSAASTPSTTPTQHCLLAICCSITDSLTPPADLPLGPWAAKPTGAKQQHATDSAPDRCGCFGQQWSRAGAAHVSWTFIQSSWTFSFWAQHSQPDTQAQGFLWSWQEPTLKLCNIEKSVWTLCLIMLRGGGVHCDVFASRYLICWWFEWRGGCIYLSLWNSGIVSLLLKASVI